MKKMILSSMIMLSGLLFSQTKSCEDLQRENDIYKKEYNILNPIDTDSIDNIDFKLISCIGDKKTRKITLTMLVINKGADTRLFPHYDSHKTILVDFAGNVLESNSDRKMQLIKNEIPTKFNIVFDNKVEVMSPSIRSINLSLFTYLPSGSSPDKQLIVNFENIDVEWK